MFSSGLVVLWREIRWRQVQKNLNTALVWFDLSLLDKKDEY